MAEKKKRIEIYLPTGTAIHPAIRRPDTKFDELGAYKCNVRVSVEDAKPTIKELQAIAKGHMGSVLPVKKNACWEYELDKETGEETGFVIFKNKAKNKNGRDGKLWDRRPAVIDAKRKVAPITVDPWSGSEVRVKCEVYLSAGKDGKKGVSLQPLVVQVLKLVTGGANGGPGVPDLSGFDDYEDGYEAEDFDGFAGGDAGDDEDPGEADY